MTTPQSAPPLLAILGPTASGKSALAVYLAHQLNGEVIACDSTQLYRGFDIGTGKPTSTERQGIPHHLLDVLEPSQEATAGGYREMALKVLSDLRERKKLPILTVGTGLYMRALFEGLADLPQRSEELRARLRASAEKHGQAHLHRLLKRLDRQSASRIAPTDTQKLLRAVEVCLLTRRPLTEVHKQGRSPLQGWQIIKIGLQPRRDELYARIHARIDHMLAAGWQGEVINLLQPRLLEPLREAVPEALPQDNSPDGPANPCSAGRPPLSPAAFSASPNRTNPPETAQYSSAFPSSPGPTNTRETAKPFDFLGYRELAAVNRHELTLDAARAAIQQSTRRYAKRQLTWFRREPNVTWFERFGDHPQLQIEILHWLEPALAKTL